MGTIATIYWEQREFIASMQMQEDRVKVALSCGDRIGEATARANNVPRKISLGDRQGAVADAQAALGIFSIYGDPRVIQLQTWLDANRPG